MEQEMHGGQSPNSGYSLIELIVTVLISAIVVTAVVGFLTTGLRHYRNVNAETELQTESQAAELFVTELIQESSNFMVLGSGEIPAGSNISYAVWVKRGSDAYILARVGHELLFSKVTQTSMSDCVQELLNAGRQKTFLAKHVSDFMFVTTSFENAESNHGLAQLVMAFEVDGKSYTSNSIISLRNTIKN